MSHIFSLRTSFPLTIKFENVRNQIIVYSRYAIYVVKQYYYITAIKSTKQQKMQNVWDNENMHENDLTIDCTRKNVLKNN